MAILYYADFSGLDAEKLINEYTGKVDKERLSKITRTLAPEAKVRSLLAGYLLQVGVREYLGIGEDILSFSYGYGANGKPYLATYPTIYFNISHSDKAVACIIASQEVGLDIQKCVAVKENIAKRFFTKEESAFLEAKRDAHKEITEEYRDWFFRLWSIKESYIKYTGQGMRQGLDSFEICFAEGKIKESGREAFYQEIKLKEMPDYTCSICMAEPDAIQVKKVQLKK